MQLNTKPLKDVEYGVPILADGTYFARIDDQKVIIKPQKSGSGNNLLVPVTLLDEFLITHDGKKIENRGQCKLTRYISLQPTEKYDPDSSLKELANALNFPPEQESFDTSDIKGFLKVKVVYQKAEGQYQESNPVVRYYPIKPEDKFTPPSF